MAENLLRLVGGSTDTTLIDSVNNVLRMVAHGSLFLVLALLVGFAFRFVKVTDLTNAAVTLVFCLLYAASDEWHQSVVPGRASELSDFLTDSAGVILAIIALQVVWTLHRLNADLAVDR